MSNPTLPTPQLVSAGYVLRSEIERLKAELAEIDAQLIALGRGKYPGLEPNEAVTVVGEVSGSTADPSYLLKPTDELVARALAGDEWKRLFDRVVIHQPCGGVEMLAPKLLTPAKSRDLLELLRVPGKSIAGKRAYVRYA